MAAKTFFLGVLGFELTDRPSSLDHIPGFWARFGVVELHIGLEDGIDRIKTNAHVALEVDDLETWRVRVEAAGCQIDASIPIPGRKRIEFRDPFGNRIEFVEYE